MIIKVDKNVVRKKRHARVRIKLSGTPDCPRLNVFRSNKHIYAQLIDDVNKVTIVSASTLNKNIASESCALMEAATLVGADIAKKAVNKGYSKVVFDRGGYLYHGRVQALAEAARANGLKF